MSITVIRDARGGSLLRSLATLGIFKAIALQSDKEATAQFVGNDMAIESSLDDVAGWLSESYVPMPVLNPWNEGSGFGTKDVAPKERIKAIKASTDARFADLINAYDACAPLAVEFREKKTPKEQQILHLRNVCPPRMIEWLDTATVLLGDGTLAFPPILGSGGNDGRLDFSTQYHEALLSVIRSDDEGVSTSQSLVDKLIQNDRTQLPGGGPGQFDPGAAGTPNTSPFGAGRAIMNPWELVMMMEGVTMFASAPARRMSAEAPQPSGGQHTTSRVAMTFSTFGSDIGTATGTTAEDTRGDIWIPSWDAKVRYQVLRELFREGRAVWRDRTVTQTPDMYCAIRSGGTADGFTAFDRFSLVKRNGLAYSAIRTDSVSIKTRNPLLKVAANVEDWPRRAGGGTEAPETILAHTRSFANARVALANAPTSGIQIHSLRTMLASVTLAELAIGRSGRTRENVPPRTVISRNALALLIDSDPQLARELFADVAFRIALGLGSVRMGPDGDAPLGRTLRECLLPVKPQGSGHGWSEATLVDGFGIRPLTDVLADVMKWYAVSRLSMDTPHRRASAIGITAPQSGVRVSCYDLSEWVTDGPIENSPLDARIQEWLLALMALDWNGTRIDVPPNAQAHVIDPRFAILVSLRNGVRTARHGAADVLDTESAMIALTPEILGSLTARNTGAAVTHGVRRLRQIGWGTVPPDRIRNIGRRDGRRVAAALLPNSFLGASTARQFRYPLRPAESDSAHDAQITSSN